MKTESGKSSALKDNNKSFDMDRETVRDILERINGLSYDGQREIIAYLKRRWSEVGGQKSLNQKTADR